MNINIYLICIFAFVLVAVAVFLVFCKTFEDPLTKNVAPLKKLFTDETIPDRRVVLMTVYKHNKVVGKCVIPYAFLSENEKSGYRIGRISFSSNDKTLRKKIGYRLRNRDLWYGIDCSAEIGSGLSSNQFRIFKVPISSKDYILTLRATHACGSGKGMYRLDDNVIVDTDRFFALVPSGFKTASYSTENNDYTFFFELANLDNADDRLKVEEIYREVCEKKPEKKKTSIIDRYFNDGTDQIVASAYSVDSSDGPSCVFGMDKNRTDKTRPYLSKEDTKVYVPGQRKQQYQKHQEYPKVL